MPAQDRQIFAQNASQWWQESGPFSPLHRLNPLRLDYIKRQLCTHFQRKQADIQALAGLTILDAGCGGGLISEPLARLGATVTGIDRDAGAIEAARDHAGQQGLDIDYRRTTPEDIAPNHGYDVILALELIEHVEDQRAFVSHLARLCAPGGLVIISTLNRTWQSWMLGIVGAEYVLGWVPQGTHNWDNFVKPGQCARYMRENSLTPTDAKGFVFNPLSGNFELSDNNLNINYIMTAHKATTDRETPT